MTLEQLHTFVAVARREHVRRAAEAIPLSQGAVSQQLHLLEQTLGVPLLERAGRGIRVTPLGREVERAAVAALAAAAAVEELAAEHRGLRRGTVRVVATNTAGVYRLPPWMAGYVDAHPGIALQLELDTTPGAIRRVADAEFDIAVVEGPFEAPDLESAVLAHEELLLVVGRDHPLAARERVDVAALRRHRYLSRGRGAATESLARRLVGAAYDASPTLELGHVDAIRAGVLTGLGYAALPRAVVRADVERGRIIVLRGLDRAVRNEFRAVRRHGSHGPAARAFWEHLLAPASSTAREPGGRRRG